MSVVSQINIFRKVPPLEGEIQPKMYIVLPVKCSELLTDCKQFTVFTANVRSCADMNVQENCSDGSRDTVEKLLCSSSESC
jgi:hypothetical protein